MLSLFVPLSPIRLHICPGRDATWAEGQGGMMIRNDELVATKASGVWRLLLRGHQFPSTESKRKDKRVRIHPPRRHSSSSSSLDANWGRDFSSRPRPLSLLSYPISVSVPPSAAAEALSSFLVVVVVSSLAGWMQRWNGTGKGSRQSRSRIAERTAAADTRER